MPQLHPMFTGSTRRPYRLASQALTVAPLKRCGYGQGVDRMPGALAGLSTMVKTMAKHDATGWYSNTLKHWQGKVVGRPPTAAELATIHALGARPGKQALANALALRPSGVTGAQIVVACGAPQLNKMRGFVTDGLVRFIPTNPDAQGHKVYRIELTAKGKAKVQAAAKANGNGKAEKPAKASKPRKAKAEKPAPAPAPSPEPVTVTEQPAQ